MNDDASLVAAALEGGPEAFGPIVDRYRDAVFGVALARLRNYHDAEDITQAVFVEAYERLGNLRNPARLGAWLRSIAIHRGIDHLRKRKEVTGIEEIAERIGDPSTPHTVMERRELRDRILAAIGKLSRPQAETTVLFYINGYSQEEIAHLQEVPVGTVKRRLHDARNRLKQEMMDVVEDELKKTAPKEDLSERVFELLCRYPQAKRLKWDVVSAELRKIGTPGIEGFVRAFALPHGRTRTWTLHMLKWAAPWSEPPPTEVMIDLFKRGLQDSNKKVRKTAGNALLDLEVDDDRKRAELVPLVVPLLFDPSKHVRRNISQPWRWKKWVSEIPLERIAAALARERDPVIQTRMRHLLQRVLKAQNMGN